MIQFGSADAFQVHSGCVLTAMVAAEPAAAIDVGGAPKVTLHFAGEGPVDVATVEPQPVDTQAMQPMSQETKVGVRHRREGILRVPQCFSARIVRRGANSRREQRTNVAADEQRMCLELVPGISAVTRATDRRDSDSDENLPECPHDASARS